MKFKGSFAPALSQGLVYATTALYGAYASYLVANPRSETIASFFDHYVFSALIMGPALICLLRGFNVPGERRVWLALGVGILCWWAGDFYSWTVLEGEALQRGPSMADVFYLSFYPAVFVGLFALLRRISDVPRTLWLQGVIAALSIAAIDAGLVLEPLQKSSSTNTLEVATHLAYPMADLVMLMLIVGAWAVAGRALGKAWNWLAGAMFMMALADSLYLFQITTGQYAPGTLMDITWPGAMLLVACAAIKDDGHVEQVEVNRRLLLLPSVAFAFAAVTLVVWDHFNRLGPQALAPAVGALIFIVIEMALSQRENIDLLDESRAEAFTDSVTHIPNRRALLRDLNAVARGADPSRPWVLMLFDLKGFKNYNDKFGHLAGDALLARLGQNLERAVSGYGTAYRHSGDEFCVISNIPGNHAQQLATAGAHALIERGDGFEISGLVGMVEIPTEAQSAVDALKLADQRMYAEKFKHTTIAPEEAAGMINMLTATATSGDSRSSLISETLKIASSIIGLDGEQIMQISRGFELRDIGNCAIPDAILNKDGKLTDEEFKVIQSHTIVGERILNAIPQLRPIAQIVRHSHERFDGEGYPDKISGDAIPVGSRLVSIAAAFDAMISDRPFRPALSFKEAVHQIGANAGSQFDPRSVSAFCQALDSTAEAIQQNKAASQGGAEQRKPARGGDGASAPSKAPVAGIAGTGLHQPQSQRQVAPQPPVVAAAVPVAQPVAGFAPAASPALAAPAPTPVSPPRTAAFTGRTAAAPTTSASVSGLSTGVPVVGSASPSPSPTGLPPAVQPRGVI